MSSNVSDGVSRTRRSLRLGTRDGLQREPGAAVPPDGVTPAQRRSLQPSAASGHDFLVAALEHDPAVRGQPVEQGGFPAERRLQRRLGQDGVAGAGQQDYVAYRQVAGVDIVSDLHRALVVSATHHGDAATFDIDPTQERRREQWRRGSLSISRSSSPCASWTACRPWRSRWTSSRSMNASSSSFASGRPQASRRTRSFSAGSVVRLPRRKTASRMARRSCTGAWAAARRGAPLAGAASLMVYPPRKVNGGFADPDGPTRRSSPDRPEASSGRSPASRARPSSSRRA